MGRKGKKAVSQAAKREAKAWKTARQSDNASPCTGATAEAARLKDSVAGASSTSPVAAGDNPSKYLSLPNGLSKVPSPINLGSNGVCKKAQVPKCEKGHTMKTYCKGCYEHKNVSRTGACGTEQGCKTAKAGPGTRSDANQEEEFLYTEEQIWARKDQVALLARLETINDEFLKASRHSEKSRSREANFTPPSHPDLCRSELSGELKDKKDARQTANENRYHRNIARHSRAVINHSDSTKLRICNCQMYRALSDSTVPPPPAGGGGRGFRQFLNPVDCKIPLYIRRLDWKKGGKNGEEVVLEVRLSFHPPPGGLSDRYDADGICSVCRSPLSEESMSRQDVILFKLNQFQKFVRQVQMKSKVFRPENERLLELIVRCKPIQETLDTMKAYRFIADDEDEKRHPSGKSESSENECNIAAGQKIKSKRRATPRLRRDFVGFLVDTWHEIVANLMAKVSHRWPMYVHKMVYGGGPKKSKPAIKSDNYLLTVPLPPLEYDDQDCSNISRALLEQVESVQSVYEEAMAGGNEDWTTDRVVNMMFYQVSQRRRNDAYDFLCRAQQPTSNSLW